MIEKAFYFYIETNKSRDKPQFRLEIYDAGTNFPYVKRHHDRVAVGIALHAISAFPPLIYDTALPY